MEKSPYTHGPSEIHQRAEVRSLIDAEKLRIGACLRAHREERRWTREKAARLIGIHPAHLAKIEQGHANVTISTLIAVAAAYSLSLKGFFQAPPRECNCS